LILNTVEKEATYLPSAAELELEAHRTNGDAKNTLPVWFTRKLSGPLAVLLSGVICSVFWVTLELPEKVRLPGSCIRDLLNVGKEKLVNSLPSTVLLKVLDWARTAWKAKQTEKHHSRTLVVVERRRKREGPMDRGTNGKQRSVGDGQING
jgi:hypothetical protein